MNIYTNKLGYGEPTNGDLTSDTVKELQRNLGVNVSGKYDIATDAAVREWQKAVGDPADPAGRSYLGPAQTALMFPSNVYTVIDSGLPTIASAPKMLVPYAIWDPISGSPGLRPFTGDARKITLHTTETAIKPNWQQQGTGIPHLTFNPADNRLWQHLPLDIAAYTLMGGANSPNSAAGLNIQIEMVGYAKDVASWPDEKYDNLHALLTWLCINLDVPMVFPFPFAGNEGFGEDGTVRKSWFEFANASGIVGHSHAPYNLHWDPGMIDPEKLFPAPKPQPPVDYVTRDEFLGALDDLAKALQAVSDKYTEK